MIAKIKLKSTVGKWGWGNLGKYCKTNLKCSWKIEQKCKNTENVKERFSIWLIRVPDWKNRENWERKIMKEAIQESFPKPKGISL